MFNVLCSSSVEEMIFVLDNAKSLKYVIQKWRTIISCEFNLSCCLFFFLFVIITIDRTFHLVYYIHLTKFTALYIFAKTFLFEHYDFYTAVFMSMFVCACIYNASIFLLRHIISDLLPTLAKPFKLNLIRLCIFIINLDLKLNWHFFQIL